MTPELVTGVIGAVGALLGAWVGAHSANSYADRQAARALTLELYRQYHSLLPDRIAADKLLAARKAAGESLEYDSIYTTLPSTEWAPVSRVRHFWDHVALIKSRGLLDSELARVLFAQDATYWYDTYFAAAEKDAEPPGTWGATWRYLSSWLVGAGR